MENLEFYLKKLLGDDNAQFKEDQKEAIEHVLANEKVLVVEKTGWGKSMVYFISCKIKRELGYGPTIIISPLLSLIRNQINSAKKLGLKARSIDSTNIEDWDTINQEIADDDCDILFISPERLANENFRINTLSLINKGIGALVIDEAHCISDWGHDFRPDYKRIKNIIKMLPKSTPVLATTATANKRVVDDICSQIGQDIKVLRGSLMRKSLILRNFNMKSEEEKLAHLAAIINEFDGCGIVYCSTTSKCVSVAKWLNEVDIRAEFYYASGMKNDDKIRIEKLLMENKIKVVVATNALGMGFDKPDIRFIVHYEKPGSLIEYYQQIGRAGRDGTVANAVLLNYQLDDKIQLLFINNAFPSKEDFEKVYKVIDDSSTGVKKIEILEKENLSSTPLNSILKILEVDGAIIKEGNLYIRTPKHWEFNEEQAASIIENKKKEFEKLNEYAQSKECLMNFIQEQLDDDIIDTCGRCCNCNGISADINVSDKMLELADKFLNSKRIIIKHRVKWSQGKNIKKEFLTQDGISMSIYKQGISGNKVYEDRYNNKKISEELIIKAAECIKKYENFEEIKWITCVPSIKNPRIVADFAEGLASKLGLPFKEIIYKKNDTIEQKFMKNSYQQEKNIIDSFDISEIDFEYFNEPVLLVDDIVNSRWTFTVCGFKLLINGSGKVIPFALASMENGGE